jgi:hypothetical protein
VRKVNEDNADLNRYTFLSPFFPENGVISRSGRRPVRKKKLNRRRVQKDPDDTYIMISKSVRALHRDERILTSHQIVVDLAQFVMVGPMLN